VPYVLLWSPRQYECAEGLRDPIPPAEDQQFSWDLNSERVFFVSMSQILSFQYHFLEHLKLDPGMQKQNCSKRQRMRCMTYRLLCCEQTKISRERVEPKTVGWSERETDLLEGDHRYLVLDVECEAAKSSLALCY
jgi:hypothetical protein